MRKRSDFWPAVGMLVAAFVIFWAMGAAFELIFGIPKAVTGT